MITALWAGVVRSVCDHRQTDCAGVTAALYVGLVIKSSAPPVHVSKDAETNIAPSVCVLEKMLVT